MQVIRLASDTDFDGWRAAARRLRRTRTPPDEVFWTVAAEEVLLDDDIAAHADAIRRRSGEGFTVPREFVDLAQTVILHRAPERFALLYRLLWRLTAEPRLMEIVTDPDVARAADLAKGVSRSAHKMKAFVRFRQVEGDPGAWLSWFEPEHRVLERTAPFFVERFANMRFVILTPDAVMDWDTRRLAFGAGVAKPDLPEDDMLGDLWKTYYRSTFNPARLKVKAMTKEMPRRYWRNLPEASLIPELVSAAEGRTRTMVAQAPTEPSKRAMKAALRQARDGSYEEHIPGDLEDVMAGVQVCRRCDLWREATQGVPGEGASHARLMFVGEQPGDQEDLAGRPFVGPAGQLFDKALEKAGVPRDHTYVTNAVKHFKHEPRGKRRIHKTPNAGEVSACRWWLDHERRLVRPRVIVALGGTAALSVFGKATPVNANRGRALALPDKVQGVVTFHPSFLLRVPDEATKKEAWGAFVEDLAFAWALAGRE
ncbi:MAG: UdgX family uracil-DNA binding protein [Caulobacter sp.]|nr:UdgX family uracil-DNA binding protein [Caulobacter sp.]